MSAPGPEVLSGLAAVLRTRLGLHLRPDGPGALRAALLTRYQDPVPPPVSLEEYPRLLATPAGEEELRRLLPLVTVGKTGFFRDQRQFGALRALFPGLLAGARAAGRRLSIWSAGCATGEEPYTIAMLAAEAGAEPGDLELLATDVNPEAAAFAREGRYPTRRVREVPAELAQRHLVEEGGEWRAGPRLRALLGAVEVHNLVGGEHPRPASGAWDVVFCRNVIIYFDTPTAQAVLGGFLQGLSPGGWLFLGYSESLFRMFEGFELAEVEGAFLYRRPAPAPPAGPPRPVLVQARQAPPAVRRGPPHPGASDGPPHQAFSAEELLDAVVQLCGAGRFAEARDRLERHLAGGHEELAARLTLANLQGILREPEAAVRSYHRALHHEPLSAEAHLFYGVHLFGVGHVAEAARELSRALFLDPDAAMAHYFLGRCREVEGDRERARLCYRNAVAAPERCPPGHSRPWAGFYPDLPEDGEAFARAARYALAVLAGDVG